MRSDEIITRSGHYCLTVSLPSCVWHTQCTLDHKTIFWLLCGYCKKVAWRLARALGNGACSSQLTMSFVLMFYIALFVLLQPHRISVRTVTAEGQSRDPQCTILFGKGNRPLCCSLQNDNITASSFFRWLSLGNVYFFHAVNCRTLQVYEILAMIFISCIPEPSDYVKWCFVWLSRKHVSSSMLFTGWFMWKYLRRLRCIVMHQFLIQWALLCFSRCEHGSQWATCEWHHGQQCRGGLDALPQHPTARHCC